MKPNILITGTPGTGKTTLANEIGSQLNLPVHNITDLVKENNWYESVDEERGCFVIDEDKIIDGLEDTMAESGNIVEYHGGDFFPERWFHLVIILRTDNNVLYVRLANRGYNQKKISENVECEIMNVIADEIEDSYEKEIIHSLSNNNMTDFENNIEKIKELVKEFTEDDME